MLLPCRGGDAASPYAKAGTNAPRGTCSVPAYGELLAVGFPAGAASGLLLLQPVASSPPDGPGVGAHLPPGIAVCLPGPTHDLDDAALAEGADDLEAGPRAVAHVQDAARGDDLSAIASG